MSLARSRTPATRYAASSTACFSGQLDTVPVSVTTPWCTATPMAVSSMRVSHASSRVTSALSSESVFMKVSRDDVVLDVAAADLRMVVELATRREERIGEREVDVVALRVGDDLLARDGHRDLRPELRAVPPVAMRQVDPDMTALDPVVRVCESLEPPGRGGLDR